MKEFNIFFVVFVIFLVVFYFRMYYYRRNVPVSKSIIMYRGGSTYCRICGTWLSGDEESCPGCKKKITWR